MYDFNPSLPTTPPLLCPLCGRPAAPASDYCPVCDSARPAKAGVQKSGSDAAFLHTTPLTSLPIRVSVACAVSGCPGIATRRGFCASCAARRKHERAVDCLDIWSKCGIVFVLCELVALLIGSFFIVPLRLLILFCGLLAAFAAVLPMLRKGGHDGK